jgi:thiol-disulfide isomerase/thioredoxin
MSNKKQTQTNKVISTVVVLCLLVAGLLLIGYFSQVGNDADIVETVEMTDGQRFKHEHEALNDVVDEDGERVYREMEINENNRIVYLSYDAFVDFMENGTGVLFFGRPGCPWCRRLIPTLLDFADEQNINIFYYYAIEQDREENNERYQHILALFDAYLPVDTSTQTEGDPDFDPNLKRVVLPQLFFVKNGEVVVSELMFNHEYLQNDDEESVRQLLLDNLNSIRTPEDICTINTC